MEPAEKKLLEPQLAGNLTGTSKAIGDSGYHERRARTRVAGGKDGHLTLSHGAVRARGG